ncbi:hypothetical protein [Maribacter sp. 2210JD10-5]|uniref:hypothetical protein n=1 Tax=Maribacter sp. 2210JD10-5 TaxID=3386272 RepID=UPI0039BCFE85
MTSVREIDFYKNVRETREFPFGTFYYFDSVVISEINEGVVFNWEMAKVALDAAQEIFGDEKPLTYISNRINSYSLIPTDWLKFYKHRHRLLRYCVVGNSASTLSSILLEKMFFKDSLRQFIDLETAIEWSLDKNEDSQIQNVS